MFNRAILSLTLCAALAGCGTALNPMNWFGRAEEAPTVQAEAGNPLIPQRRQGIFARARAAEAEANPPGPISQIADLQVERVPGGAIIRARGIDAFANSFDAGLRALTEEETPVDGVLSYSFERRVPEGTVPGGAEATREITVARFVSDQTLRGVRSIRVEAAGNAQVVRR